MATIRILIVEDEILIAREIEGCLQELGYGIAGIAADAETALQQIDAAKPDLMLIDIVIQGEQDGIALAGQVHDRYQIPTIYLTAYVDEQTLARAKLTRPFGYILKPFYKTDLRIAVEIALARHQWEAEEKSTLTSLVERYTQELAKQPVDSTSAQPFEYLSILSHELRNPIAAIQLATTMLGAYGNQVDEAKKQQLLQRIQSAATTMNQLIEDVLALGQTEYPATQFHPEATNLVEFCQTLVETFQWNANDRFIIDFTYQPDKIQAWVDKKLLWHALSNLVGNAIKYSPDNINVGLRLSCTTEAICFEVQDYGIGISPADLELLFQPFYRGCNVGKVPGTGLGLAIAKRAAEMHGGNIAVDSHINHGSTFVVKLPLQPAQIV